MFDIIPLIIILLSFGVIITIVARKFSVLANLNVESIQEVREARMKEQIIGTKIKRNFFKYYHRLGRLIAPIGHGVANMFGWAYRRLHELKKTYEEEEAAQTGGENVVAKLLAEADELFKGEELAAAEGKYIEAIGLDPKNIQAFRQLARLYFDRKDYNESKETYKHVLKLMEKDPDRAKGLVNGEDLEDSQVSAENYDLLAAMMLYELSLVEKTMDDMLSAADTIEQALALEPNNPRYLDTKLEFSIMNKDKTKALEAYDKLANANPENQKLGEWKSLINGL